MNQTIGRACTVLALACLGTLHGCGGGGGGSGGGGASPPPAPGPGAYLTVGETASNSSTVTQLRIVDADNPGSPRLTVTLNAPENHLELVAFSMDAATKAYTYLGESMSFYVKNHQLFQVSLRKSDSTVAQRISSLSTACTVEDWYPLQLGSGTDTWIELTEAGPDGDCAQTADNRTVYVRTGAAATTPATPLPAGVELLDSMPNEALTGVNGFVAVDTRGASPKLTLYSADLTPLGDLAGGAGLSSMEFMSFIPGRTGAEAYVRTGSSLRRLSWPNSGSASLSSSLYTFTGLTGSVNSGWTPIDASAMYFVDGLEVRKIDGAGNVSLLATLSSAHGSTAELGGLAGNRLVISQGASTSATTTLLSLSTSGGTPLPLVTGTDEVALQGLNGTELIYSTHALGAPTWTLRRVQADGSNNRLITSSSGSYPLPVLRRTMDYSGFQLASVAWCEPAVGSNDCRNSALRSLNLSTGAIVTLGSFSHTTNAASWYLYGYGYEGSPMVITTSSYPPPSYVTQRDMYLAQPQQANSLTRLSTNIP